MNWRARLTARLRPVNFFNNTIKPEAAGEAGPSGFMAFSHTGQVVAARRALLEAGLSPQIKAPPPNLREGCDMVLEFPAELSAVYLAVLEEKKLRPLAIKSIDGPLTAPESLFRKKTFANCLMVQAANMKLTIDQASGRVVNISGGGCPDVPYLAEILSGNLITEVEKPDELSRSLCSFSLAQAKEEAERLFLAGQTESVKKLKPLGRDQESLPALPWPRKKNWPRQKPWLIVGTLGQPEAPLHEGSFHWQKGFVEWAGQKLTPTRGTAALMAAYAITAEVLGLPPGRAVLAGDNGQGNGSRLIYEWLVNNIQANPWSGLTFHYLFPDASWHDRIFLSLDELSPRPLLAADAGFMYVAKMCGQAQEYDLFTPDAGEMAYLADPLAPHPFYTRGALIQSEPGPTMFKETHQEGNAARTMLVKGQSDYIVWRGRVIHQVGSPVVPALEAIGGTGDTATGLASAFMAAGYSPARSSALAAHLNRRLGLLAAPEPQTSIAEILTHLPDLLRNELPLSLQ